MSTPWEIDPTEPNRDGAEGGAAGGDSAGDSNLPPPLQPPEDIDRTNPFQPTGASTPYPPEDTGETIELSTMDLNELDVAPDEVPLLSAFLDAEDQQKAIDDTNRLIQDKFPNVDFSQIDPIGWGKKPENRGEIVSFGKGKGGKFGETRVLKKGGRGFLKAFTDKFSKALGPSAEELIAQENQEIRELKQRTAEAERQLKEGERLALIKQKATDEIRKRSERLEQVKARIDALKKEQGSNLEAQTEIDQLKRLKQNLKTDINTYQKEIATATKIQKQRAQERGKLQKDVDKLKATSSAKVKERNEIETEPKPFPRWKNDMKR